MSYPSDEERNWMRTHGRSPTVDEFERLKAMRDPTPPTMTTGGSMDITEAKRFSDLQQRVQDAETEITRLQEELRFLNSPAVHDPAWLDTIAELIGEEGAESGRKV